MGVKHERREIEEEKEKEKEKRERVEVEINGGERYSLKTWSPLITSSPISPSSFFLFFSA